MCDICLLGVGIVYGFSGKYDVEMFYYLFINYIILGNIYLFNVDFG